MLVTLRILVLATVLTAFMTGAALADKQAYTTMTPEQIEKAIRAERQAYREAMNQLRELENSGMDKKSPEYKARFDDLITKAEQMKVDLDWMREALTEQEKAFGGQ